MRRQRPQGLAWHRGWSLSEFIGRLPAGFPLGSCSIPAYSAQTPAISLILLQVDVVSRPLTLFRSRFTVHTWLALKKRVVATAKHLNIEKYLSALRDRCSVGICDKAGKRNPCPLEAYSRRTYIGAHSPVPQPTSKELKTWTSRLCDFKEFMWEFIRQTSKDVANIHLLSLLVPPPPFSFLQTDSVCGLRKYCWLQLNYTKLFAGTKRGHRKKWGNRRERSLILPEAIWNKISAKLKHERCDLQGHKALFVLKYVLNSKIWGELRILGIWEPKRWIRNEPDKL